MSTYVAEAGQAELRVLLDHAFCARPKRFDRLVIPPLLEVSVLVELSALRAAASAVVGTIRRRKDKWFIEYDSRSPCGGCRSTETEKGRLVGNGLYAYTLLLARNHESLASPTMYLYMHCTFPFISDPIPIDWFSLLLPAPSSTPAIASNTSSPYHRSRG